MSLDLAFSRFASRAARLTGRPGSFLLCVAVVLAWAVTGPMFGFSETWQLVINTGTTIITFLMVFLIQNTQNRDAAAVQAKLDELILTSNAQNGFIGIEQMSDKELQALQLRFAKAAEQRGDLLDEIEKELAGEPEQNGPRPAARRPAGRSVSKQAPKAARPPRRKRAKA
ncbi:MAG TPA: low affinity iron permease family protein [Caulobacter sp.]|nr:low affinity iron permease family protein [Caulobacter sp.]